MKKSLSLFAFLFLILSATFAQSAQNVKIDSLQRVIATTRVDTVKGRSMCRLCESLRTVGEMNLAIQTAEEGLKLLINKKDLKGKANCHIVLGGTYMIQSNLSKSLEHYEKGLEIYIEIQDAEKLPTTLFNIAAVLEGLGKYPEAIEYYQKGSAVLRSKGQKLPCGLLVNLSGLYQNIGDLEQALTYSKKV